MSPPCVERWGFPVPLETHTGSVTALPFDDATFDALWCANVTLHLSDAELEKALAEFRRVVKPGDLALRQRQQGGREIDGGLCVVALRQLDGISPGCSANLQDGTLPRQVMVQIAAGHLPL